MAQNNTKNYHFTQHNSNNQHQQELYGNLKHRNMHWCTTRQWC